MMMHSSSDDDEESSFEESEDYDETDDDDGEEESAGEDEDEDDFCGGDEGSIRNQKPPGGLQPDAERQISVDPLSLKHAPVAGPPALVRPRFVSCSLPGGTATSSSPPRWGPPPADGSMKWSDPTAAKKPPRPAAPHLARRHSVAPSSSSSSHFAQQPPRPGSGLFRSKSCGDGRSSQPSDEFDILSGRHVTDISQPQSRGGLRVVPKPSSKEREDVQPRRSRNTEDGEFNCGALCLFLPPAAFSKKKKKKKEQEAQARRDERTQAIGNGEGREERRRSELSRIASLEKFECASWASSAVPGDIEEELGGPVNAYFDLPLELIRGGGDDADSPVRAAFVFDGGRRGGLKKSTSRRSHESSNRHVRFSTSAAVVSYPPSPTSACITPRLLRAREEFNALLEAQSACMNF